MTLKLRMASSLGIISWPPLRRFLTCGAVHDHQLKRAQVVGTLLAKHLGSGSPIVERSFGAIVKFDIAFG